MDRDQDSLLQESPKGTRWSRYLTARLTLRPIMAGDFPLLSTIFADPRTTAHRPDPRPETVEECRQRLDRYLEHWAMHGFGTWTLEDEGAAIGFGGLTHRDGFTGLNLSYHLHPDFWRHGYASEFAAAAGDIALQDIGTSRVIGVVRHVNLASRRVLEKTDFILTREIVFGGYPGLLYVKSCPGS
ncbi:MAG TPA: GNAT family N-acetyltransferase [Dongiaceae bacterium]|nr:GNAT family N-acetyltransferase [Dongiaceae bacterium]